MPIATKTLVKKLLIALPLFLATAGAVHADSVRTDFTGAQVLMADQYISPVPASPASLTLTLNPNGTIAAYLDVVGELGSPQTRWTGVGFDSGVTFNETDINSYGHDGYGGLVNNGLPSAWGTSFGGYQTGIDCYYGGGTTDCKGPVSWTIGDIGQFTSVTQLFAGTDAQFDAFFYRGDQYAGDFVPVSDGTVPEPASIALLGLGAIGIVGARRHRPA